MPAPRNMHDRRRARPSLRSIGATRSGPGRASCISRCPCWVMCSPTRSSSASTRRRDLDEVLARSRAPPRARRPRRPGSARCCGARGRRHRRACRASRGAPRAGAASAPARAAPRSRPSRRAARPRPRAGARSRPRCPASSWRSSRTSRATSTMPSTCCLGPSTGDPVTETGIRSATLGHEPRVLAPQHGSILDPSPHDGAQPGAIVDAAACRPTSLSAVPANSPVTRAGGGVRQRDQPIDVDHQHRIDHRLDDVLDHVGRGNLTRRHLAPPRASLNAASPPTLHAGRIWPM